MTPAPHWKTKLFGSESVLRPEARIRSQVDGLERFLELKHRSRVLDLGCGAGAQTLELARRQYRVVGMEATTEALAGGRERAKSEALTVHFLASRLDRIPYDGEFNAVIIVRNPLGSLPSERDDLRCLQAVHRSLKPGGRLLLDLLNREWLVRNLGAHDGAFDLVTGRLDGRGFSSRGGKPPKGGETLRVYALTELRRLLADGGFRVHGVWGDYHGKPYGLDSMRLIVAADRVEPPRKSVPDEDDGERAVRIKGRPR
ncbi:MAG: class I SAM-dependent methyltransferase [Elusimicrobia bacterium]|nr:class I SAM-dependent methyltransferase [Elusimicrobiota bacterium]